ncbi:MAG: arginine deiminase [Lachnospiraceae bacterium]|nr:arginine deiminase [Lachnospiraceae bacterium]
MAIRVASEIAPLRKVLLHRPGAELEHLVPEELERLLFDDIPFLRNAQAEHDAFAQVLRGEGVEVVYLEDLAAEVFEKNETARRAFIRQFVAESGGEAEPDREHLERFLTEIHNAHELVRICMSGIRASQLPRRRRSHLADLLRTNRRFLLDPIPNLYFTRDPFACIGRGVSLNRMYSPTRRRETIFGQYILQYHPDFAGTPLYTDRTSPYSIEGGDILNLSESVVAVGISQRTSPEGVEALAQSLFADRMASVDTVLALYIPGMRAYMHLDTVFTQVDEGKFVVHPGILQSLRCFILRPSRAEGVKIEESADPLDKLLGSVLGTGEVTLIRCGGTDNIAAEREQWNDGSNTLAVAPGRVIVYDRNVVTNEILRGAGVTTLEIPSAELSRGRGGPRCMSMPLQRG